jgi:hypothetical protein
MGRLTWIRCVVSASFATILISGVAIGRRPMTANDEPETSHRRTCREIQESEEIHKILKEWERVWFSDQPDPSSPYRTHGSII